MIVPRLNHALGATAVAATALAIWPWLVPPIPAARPLAPPPANAPATILAPLPPLASYGAIVDRPLFSPARRPPPGAEAGSGVSIESRYRLLGVVANGPRRTALIADGAQRREITVGDVIDGWTVKEIGPDRVDLSSPAGEAALKLKPAAAEPQKP